MAYRGTITIITSDGTEVQAVGTLQKSGGSGLQSWGGIAAADPSLASTLEPGAIRLRLSDGTEADALLRNVSHRVTQGVEPTMALTILGSGPAPF